MKLPHRRNAYIPRAKLTNYLLSEDHPVGGSKAVFFRGIGFNKENIEQFEKLLLNIGQNNEVKDIRNLPYGKNYSIRGTIESPNGKVVVITTVWFIKTSKTRPSFVTAYPV